MFLQSVLRACSFCKQPVLELSKIFGQLHLAQKSLSSWKNPSGDDEKAFSKRTEESAKRLSHDQKMDKLEKLRKMELELAELCLKCYAQKVECDKMLKVEDDSRAKGLYLYSSFRSGNLPNSESTIQKKKDARGRSNQKKNDARWNLINRKGKRKHYSKNINFALEEEDRAASEILKQIRQESARLDTEVKAKISPCCKGLKINSKPAGMEIVSYADLTSGDLYSSTSEGEHRSVNEVPQSKVVTFSPEENQNKIKMKSETKRSEKKRSKSKESKHDRKGDTIKRNRLYQKPSTITEYLYELFRGRRSIATFSVSQKRNYSSGKWNRTRHQGKSHDKKSVRDNVFISPDLAQRGLGAEAILKERRTKSKNISDKRKSGEQKTQDVH